MGDVEQTGAGGKGEELELHHDRETRVVLRRGARVSNATWSTSHARVGQEVELTADVIGARASDTAVFRIYEVDQDGSEELVEELEGELDREVGQARATWSYVFTPDPDDPPRQEGDEEFQAPEYVFECAVGRSCARTEEILAWKHWIALQVHGPVGPLPPRTRYQILFHLAPIVISGNLEPDGWLRVDSVPPGTFDVVIEGYDIVGMG